MLADSGPSPRHAARGAKTADVKDDAGGVDAGVLVLSRDGDAVVGRRDGVGAGRADEALARSILLPDGGPARFVELGCLLADLETSAEHDHDCSVRRRTLLQLTVTALVTGCDRSRVVPWEHGALALAVTPSHVYWTSGIDHGALLAVPREGGEIKVLYDGMPTATGLAPGSEAMFVASGRGVERAPYHGLRGTLLVDEPEGAHRVIVDDDDVFWLVRRSGLVRRATLRGEAVVTVAEGPPWANDLAISSDAIVWTSGEPGRVSRVARAGGSVDTLVEGMHGLGSVAIVKDHVYVGHATGVSRVPLRGGEVSPVAEGRSSPSSLRRLGEGLCWSEAGRDGRDRIVRWSEDGERTTDGGRVLALAVSDDDGPTVWWMDGADGALRRQRF